MQPARLLYQIVNLLAQIIPASAPLPIKMATSTLVNGKIVKEMDKALCPSQMAGGTLVNGRMVRRTDKAPPGMGRLAITGRMTITMTMTLTLTLAVFFVVGGSTLVNIRMV